MLRIPLLALILAASVRYAHACPECASAADPSTLAVDVSPTAVFRPNAAGGLDADEAAWLAAAEAGRYRPRPLLVVDTLAATPAGHAQAEGFEA